MASGPINLLQIEDFSFSYPGEACKAVKNISLTIEVGSFHILAGCSGSGKTTLLRHLKPMLAPHGTRSGEIYFEGKRLIELPYDKQVTEIGYLFQDPENQIVMHRVSEELAFGLENLGMPSRKIKRRVAEMVTYFGITSWYDAPIHTLSGGQKQILNLAAIMTMDPKILVLDEPTAGLDPISAEEFFQILCKLREDMGVTILLSEQRLGEILSRASALTLMEKGEIAVHGTPRDVGQQLIHTTHPMLAALPVPMQAFAKASSGEICPLTIAEGRKWFQGNRKRDFIPSEKFSNAEKSAVIIKELAFQYEKKGREILRDFKASVTKGVITGIVGCNGSGKSTLLSLLAGAMNPVYGKIKMDGRAAMLPQNPKHLFLEDTVEEELGSVSPVTEEAIQMFQLEHLKKRHPYDLSGGEMARLAFAKIFLLQPDIYLLDEPTRGMDAVFKKTLADIFHSLIKQGKTIILVSHDIEFLSVTAEHAIFLFQGKSVYEGKMREFLEDNIFYSTGASKMTKGIADGIITVQDVVSVCKNL